MEPIVLSKVKVIKIEEVKVHKPVNLDDPGGIVMVGTGVVSTLVILDAKGNPIEAATATSGSSSMKPANCVTVMDALPFGKVYELVIRDPVLVEEIQPERFIREEEDFNF